MRILGLSLFTLLVWTAAAAPVEDFASKTEVTKPTRLWTEPTKFGEAIAALEPGLKLKVENYSTTGSWLKVQTPGGRIGWVPVRHTSLAGQPLYRGVKARAEAKLGERTPASAAALDESNNQGKYISGSIEYANQVSVGKANGFGLGVVGGYFVNPHFAPGLWISYNHFIDSASDTVNEVKRTANRYFIGPNIRFQTGHFAVDASLGVDIINTTFTVKDIASGGLIQTSCTGSTSESALGFNLRPAYLFPMGATTLLELYTAWGVGFHGGDSCIPNESGSVPQQLSLGVSLHTPL